MAHERLSSVHVNSSKIPAGNDDQSRLVSSRQLLVILSCLVPVAILAVVIFEFVHLRWSDVDFEIPVKLPNSKPLNRVPISQFFDGIWPITRIYWDPVDGQDAAPGHSKFLGVACLALGAGQILLELLLSFWSQEFWDVVSQKKAGRYAPLLIRFSLLAALFILTGVYMSYLQSMLEIRWRQHLTEHLQRKWLAHKVFYHMQLEHGDKVLDNPDQRIQEDAGLFVKSCLSAIGGFLSAIGYLVVFLPLLLYLSPAKAFGVFRLPGWLALFVVSYSIVGSLISHLLGEKLIGINFAQQGFEANFRYAMLQIKDYSESIALYGSEDCESRGLADHFQAVKRIWWENMHYTKLLGLFQRGYAESNDILPLFLLVPNYFQNQITFGTVMSIARVVGNLKIATDWVIQAYSELAEFRGTTDRLSIFLSRMELQPMTKTSIVEDPDALPVHLRGQAAVAVTDLCVDLPQTQPTTPSTTEDKGPDRIWCNTELIVKPGTFVLLSAPEGTGKTCFFRAIAGIWPYSSGNMFFSSDPVFVPQKPTLPLGTLKQVVAYPQSADTYLDNDARRALLAVGLESLARRQLEETADWSLILSGGEQQRLAMARVLLQRPSCIFLDEATSAIGAQGALTMYKLLRSQGTLPKNACVVTISHQVELLSPLHDIHYTHRDGRWVTTSEM